MFKKLLLSMSLLILASAVQAGISKKQIMKAQKEWGNGIVAIGKAKVNGENYRKLAVNHIKKLYDYGNGKVLFKPTKAKADQFRETFDEALSYFVKGKIREDGGFAINPWLKVRFDNHNIRIIGDTAMAMGNYYFTTGSDAEVKVEYTFVYRLDKDGNLRIVVHHSSLPYNS